MDKDILMAITVTMEATGTNLSDTALEIMVSDLDSYPKNDVLKALQICRRELRGRLTLADIISKIDDGWISADEAWGIAVAAMDESKTVVSNDVIAESSGAAKDIYDSGDDVGARMAFKAAYNRIVDGKRMSGTKPVWWPSFGFDVNGREIAILDAVNKKRLTHEQANKLLPHKQTETMAALVDFSFKRI